MISLQTLARLAVSDARGLGWLLFSPRGWMGRINYLRGAALILMANSLLAAAAFRLAGQEAAPLACLVTLYPAICVAAKRLHGLGRSAWLQAPVRLLMTMAVVLLAVDQHPAQSDGPALAIALFVLLGGLGEAALFIWLALAANRLAPPLPIDVFD